MFRETKEFFSWSHIKDRANILFVLRQSFFFSLFLAYKKQRVFRDCPSGPVGLLLSLQGAWVWSLVRELRFHMLHGTAKKNLKQTHRSKEHLTIQFTTYDSGKITEKAPQKLYSKKSSRWGRNLWEIYGRVPISKNVGENGPGRLGQTDLLLHHCRARPSQLLSPALKCHDPQMEAGPKSGYPKAQQIPKSILDWRKSV